MANLNALAPEAIFFPPILRIFKDIKEIESYVLRGEKLPLPPILNHNQLTEKRVQDTWKAGQNCPDLTENDRRGKIHCTNEARIKFPRNANKSVGLMSQNI